MTLDMTCHVPALEGRIIRIMSCLITLEFLVHLFLERRFASCSLRFSRLPTPLCTLLWQNWGKMAQAAEEGNAPIFQKWAFFEEDCIPDTQERMERWGGTQRDLLKSEERGLCKICFLEFFLIM